MSPVSLLESVFEAEELPPPPGGLALLAGKEGVVARYELSDMHALVVVVVATADGGSEELPPLPLMALNMV
ncbi:hypothetical protein DIPPA_17179 [Diplonema papillatum]|nr:hypothetical protein DIPPA_17179 [Diplonema papillatum]